MHLLRPSENCKQGLVDLVNFIGCENLTMLEVGSYNGESAQVFLNTNAFSSIYCLDAWEGGYDSRDWASNNIANSEQYFLNFAKQNPDIIKVYKNYSREIPSLFEDEFFDLIYIDANHSFDAVKADILSCLPKVKKGGYIAGHDYGYSMFEVKDAVDQTIGQPDKIFCDTSWIKLK